MHEAEINDIIFPNENYKEFQEMDSISDNSYRTLWRIIKAAGAPDYVQNGVLVDEKDAESLSDAVFADPGGRHFPLTDKANTWVSAGYFAKTSGDYNYNPLYKSRVEDRIKEAAELYGITKDVEHVMACAAPKKTEKKASENLDNYCDPENRGFPVFDKQGAELANDFFTRNAYKYGYDRRMPIARNIMKKCAEYGVEPSEQVRLSSLQGYPNRDVLAEHLMFRADTLMGRGLHKAASNICKIAKEICICADSDLDENKEALFRTIAGMDELEGLDNDYGRRFYAPEEMFDIMPEDMKAVIDDAVPLGHETFSAKALSDLPRALFEQVLPKSKVEEMMEGGHISPKKLSVTIISMGNGGPESHHLLKTIRDFTSGNIDFDEEEPAEGPVVDIEVEKKDDGEKVEEPEKDEKSEKPEKEDEKED